MIDAFYHTPPDYQSFVRKLQQLKEQYPFIRLFSVGKSVMGKNLYAISIGNAKNSVLYAGAFHALEWLTQSLLVLFTETLCKHIDSGTRFCSIDLKNALESHGIVIIPCVNPDGVDLVINGIEAAGTYKNQVLQICEGDLSDWQANIRGVDINHNFNAGFQILKEMEMEAGIVKPSPRQYGGAFAESEPETRSLCKFCCSFNIRQALAFHSQGEEIFFEYGEHTPPRSKVIAHMLANSSGYELVSQQGLASHGGFKDWFIDKLIRPAFTIEIGRGKNPLPITELEPIFGRLVEMMMLGILI